MLATHVTFGGRLFDENNNEIKKSSLSKIWETKNRSRINETYNLLLDCGYIQETEGGCIMISKNIIVKGEIEYFKKLKREDKDLTYTRVFTSNLIELYKGTKPKQRKQLANLFKVLPFINFKHNVFCTNPTEPDFDKMVLLSWTDMAKICGYESNANITKFKKDLWNLEIYGRPVLGQFSCKKGYYIAINPKVYYGGNNIEDVQFLYKSFRLFENKK